MSFSRCSLLSVSWGRTAFTVPSHRTPPINRKHFRLSSTVFRVSMTVLCSLRSISYSAILFAKTLCSLRSLWNSAKTSSAVLAFVAGFFDDSLAIFTPKKENTKFPS
uniref:Uncharacterized protein n=1 Tax=Lutzomyia longipalpis TaxID=7200 RepID=A0A7G3B5Q4_LUTLO